MLSAVVEQPGSASLQNLGRTLEDEPWYARAKTLEKHSPSQTVVPPHSRPDASGIRALGALTSVASERGAPITAAIELGETIGEGGMGVVRLGTQIALGRSVAVKTLKKGISSEAATLKVLREAWITGSLEHPNVVPIYDVGIDAEGRPLIVLKKIEGTEWSQLMDDSAAVAGAFGVHDLLEWNLGILLAVCNAARFAHSRGILHRDLKPDNVMIGEFGEVYLVDWGIAVSLVDDGSGRLPLAKDATELAGTPHYMAPEMLGGSGARLSERSDVYLLGAILYEVVTGKPPHQGDNLMAVVASVATSVPNLPFGLPEELGAIVRRAMHRDPDARFESVDAFRLALLSFLEHRGSMTLTREADDRRAHLLGYIAAAEVGDETARDRIYNLFSECRFGYRGALDGWRDNVAAREGLRISTEAMIGYELAHDDPRAASILAAQLDLVAPEIKARIDEASQRKAERQSELQSLADQGRKEDREIGRRTRVFLTVTLGAVCVLLPVFVSLFMGAGARSWGWAVATPTITLLVLFGIGRWARESFSKTDFNRRVGGVVVVGFAIEIPMHMGHYLAGISVVESQVQVLLLWATIMGMCVFVIDRRLLVAAILTTALYLIASAHPELRWYMMSANALVILTNFLFIWQVRQEDVAELEKRVRSRLTGRPPPPPPAP
jgi:serine/threonine-protein kinase